MIFRRYHLAIFARWKTFAPKHRKLASLKQHSEHSVWCLTVTLCVRIVHRQLSAHFFSHSVKLLTDFLIGSYGRLSQNTCNPSLSSVIDLCFGRSLSHRVPDMVLRGLGELWGHWSFLMNSGSWPEAIPVRCCLSLIAVVKRETI